MAKPNLQALAMDGLGVLGGHALELSGEYYKQKLKDDFAANPTQDPTKPLGEKDGLLFGFDARAVVSYGGGAALIALPFFLRMPARVANGLALAGVTAISGRAARQMAPNVSDKFKTANVSSVRSYAIPQRTQSVFQAPRAPQRDLDVRVD